MKYSFDSPGQESVPYCLGCKRIVMAKETLVTGRKAMHRLLSKEFD